MIATLAQEIWREHYPGIITHEQIEYMLTRMYDVDELARQLAAGTRFDLAVFSDHGISVSGGADASHPRPVAFASYGPTGDLRETRLHKLYVSKADRRRGIGAALIARAEAHARASGSLALSLTVNRANAAAIAAYQRLGFAIRESAVVDIGGGFVMDDHVMALALG